MHTRPRQAERPAGWKVEGGWAGALLSGDAGDGAAVAGMEAGPGRPPPALGAQTRLGHRRFTKGRPLQVTLGLSTGTWSRSSILSGHASQCLYGHISQ